MSSARYWDMHFHGANIRPKEHKMLRGTVNDQSSNQGLSSGHLDRRRADQNTQDPPYSGHRQAQHAAMRFCFSAKRTISALRQYEQDQAHVTQGATMGTASAE